MGSMEQSKKMYKTTVPENTEMYQTRKNMGKTVIFNS